jgi:hypothetical protein
MCGLPSWLSVADFIRMVSYGDVEEAIMAGDQLLD